MKFKLKIYIYVFEILRWGLYFHSRYLTNCTIKKFKNKYNIPAATNASTGAKVLHTRSVELAMKNNLILQVLSSLAKKSGTLILDEIQKRKPKE